MKRLMLSMLALGVFALSSASSATALSSRNGIAYEIQVEASRSTHASSIALPIADYSHGVHNVESNGGPNVGSNDSPDDSPDDGPVGGGGGMDGGGGGDGGPDGGPNG